MQHLNTQISAYHTVATVTPPRPSHAPLQHHLPGPRRTRATSWWGMTLLVAGLLGGWVVMGVGGGVFLGLLVGLWLWAGCIDTKGGAV
jgi:hypothetical protein